MTQQNERFSEEQLQYLANLLKNKHIVIANDCLILLRTWQRALKTYSSRLANIHLAVSVKEVGEKFSELSANGIKIDLLITDNSMPNNREGLTLMNDLSAGKLDSVLYINGKTYGIKLPILLVSGDDDALRELENQFKPGYRAGTSTANLHHFISAVGRILNDVPESPLPPWQELGFNTTNYDEAIAKIYRAEATKPGSGEGKSEIAAHIQGDKSHSNAGKEGLQKYLSPKTPPKRYISPRHDHDGYWRLHIEKANAESYTIVP